MFRTTSAKAAHWPWRAGPPSPAAITAYLAGPEGERYDYVIATQDFHRDPGSHFSAHPDFALSWPPHCVAGTGGAQFHPDLDASRIDEVFRKGEYAAAYSGFEGNSAGGDTLAELALGAACDRH